MKKEFVPYTLALVLKSLEFNEPCFATYRKHGPVDSFDYELDYHSKVQLDHNVIPINSEYVNDWISAPIFQQVFDWFEEKYELSSLIYTVFPYDKSPSEKYWVFGITDKTNDLIVDPNDWFGNLLEQAHQDIPGNHVNDKVLNELIFSTGYGHKVKIDAKIACLTKMIEIVKERK